MNSLSKTAARTALLSFPSEGELVLSPHYMIRVKAGDARAVEVSIDGGPFKACNGDSQSWSYDWTGYAAGSHMICARITYQDGSQETLRPRALRVAFASQHASEVKEGAAADIGRALAFLKEQQVKFVQLWFTDIGGKPWRISLPVEHITEGAFSSGVTLDGPSTSLSFKSYINLIPDPKAVYLDPLATVPTAAIICDLYEPPDTAPVALGVRQTLRSAVEELGKVKAGLTVTMGAEAEFFLLEPNGQPCPEEDLWQFLNDLARTLQESGIKSEGFRYGPARGQGRVQMRWADPVRTADNLILYRWFARSLARARGKTLSFQQNAPSGQGAASMPVHHTLWLGEANAFHDEEGWQYTSELCRHYVGGILNHAWAIAAFVGGSSSSYPLRSGALASVLKPYLSAKNPDALCRVPERMLYAAGRRVKTRAGGADSNPYLSLAAMLLAGVDGIRKGIEPDMEPKSAMPGTLDDALRGLHEDREFLKQGGFTDRLVEAWIAQRREHPAASALDA
jgi:glutamine synthetase